MRCSGMQNVRRLLAAGLLASLGCASSSLADGVVYDQMTGLANTNWFSASAVVTTGATGSGNNFMGPPVIFAPSSSLEITGFDSTLVNATGATITIDAATGALNLVRLRYWVWNRVGFLAATAPDNPRAYGPYTPITPAGTGSVAFNGGAAPISLPTGNFLAFTAGTLDATTIGSPGTAPAIPITPHVTVTSAGPIGFTFNWQTSADGGVTWTVVNGLTTLIAAPGNPPGNVPAAPPATGVNGFVAAGGTGGYFRSPALEDQDGTGSFLVSSGRTAGVDSGVAIRVYVNGTVVAGACCNPASGACTVSSTGQTGCAAGSTYGGNGTTCALNCAAQACCSGTTGFCVLTGTDPCPSGLTAVGAGSSCAPNNPCLSPINDECTFPAVLTLNQVYLGSNSNATADGGSDGPITSTCYQAQFNKAVWFNFTAPATTNYKVSMCGTPFDSVLSVFSGPDCNTLTEVACNDDFVAGDCAAGATSPGPGPQSAFASHIPTVALTAGTTYRIRVAAFGAAGAGGNFGLQVSYVDATTVGSCCTPSTCILTDAAGCANTFAAGGVCSPNPCTAAGVCCRGATCNTTVGSSAACSASLISGGLAGAAFPAGAACNSGPVSSSPCCYANYNKVNGVNVQDIFDFLGDWFAGSKYANTGGNGNPATLSVQNIFDFLTNWFNGGCS